MTAYHVRPNPGIQGTPKIQVNGTLRTKLACRLLELEVELECGDLHRKDIDELAILRRLITGGDHE